ncbi:MAG: hypothetical protein IKM64_06185 [Clostridia bacterium]|nr:hypothetical protein [Clostridia bacterium]
MKKFPVILKEYLSGIVFVNIRCLWRIPLLCAAKDYESVKHRGCFLPETLTNGEKWNKNGQIRKKRASVETAVLPEKVHFQPQKFKCQGILGY